MTNMNAYSKFQSLLNAYITKTISVEEVLFYLVQDNIGYLAQFEEMMFLNSITQLPAIKQNKELNFIKNILPHLNKDKVPKKKDTEEF